MDSRARSAAPHKILLRSGTLVLFGTLIAALPGFRLSTAQVAAPPTAPTPSGGEDHESTTCPLDGPLSGAWQEEGGADRLLLLSEHGVVIAEDGKLQAAASIVHCEPGKVVVCAFAATATLSFSLQSDRLEIEDSRGGRLRRYRRLDQIPEIFTPRPFEIPAPGPLPAERIVEIQTELERRQELDQGIRTQKDPDFEEWKRIDAENTAYLKGLTQEIGWIDVARFGRETATSAFLIVQHSGDVPFMMGALPHMRSNGILSQYALLYDRLRLWLGGKQRYGSQVTQQGGGGVLPIETLEGIDELRATMDLEPLPDYLARFGIDEVREADCGPP